jgi:2,4-diketo-3-deoxy-L-fuconate hydrolase
LRLANIDGRMALLIGDEAVDVARASGDRFGPEPAVVYDQWDTFREWAADAMDGRCPPGAGPAPATGILGAPSPRPRQVFALALNYRDHARATGFTPPDRPSVFTKFPSSLTGPYGHITLPPGDVDWEVELVVVIGRLARHVAAADGWAHVAGLTVGQDLSERRLQFADPTPQFSLAKSFPGFSPTGPYLVTPDELDDPDDLALGCLVNGEPVQQARTSQLVFGVPELVARLSSILPLLPGDLLFTGTPAGVGGLRNPPRFLQPGDQLTSWVDGIGEMRHQLQAPHPPAVGHDV